MSKVFSGHQPNFLPYMGFFYKMYKSDVFVYDDDVQYTNKEYASDGGIRVGHNSNAIRTANGKAKILVPVSYDFGDKINEVLICRDTNWEDRMLKTIRMSYGKYPYYDLGMSILEKALNCRYEHLYLLNRHLLDAIVEGFGFKTKIVTASIDCPTSLKNNDRNIYQCKKLGADVYFSGAGGGKEYNDEQAYVDNGIKLVYSDYKPTPYRQYHKKDFMENLSVIDYIFNEGFKIPESWR